jgi:hypothetical protein
LTDPLLMPLAEAILADYAPGAVPTWQNSEKTCAAFAGQIAVGRQSVTSIRLLGTTDLLEWVVDDFNPLETPAGVSSQIGPVHQASLNNVRGVLPMIQAYLAALGNPPYALCGHSKGGREAAIACALLKAAGTPPAATRLFECPRPGGEQLATYLRGEDVVGTRTWNCHGADVVTLVPFGPGWADPCPLLDLRVPDDLGIAGKHRISGVIAGLSALA